MWRSVGAPPEREPDSSRDEYGGYSQAEPNIYPYSRSNFASREGTLVLPLQVVLADVVLFDFQTQKWSQLAKVRTVFLNWSLFFACIGRSRRLHQYWKARGYCRRSNKLKSRQPTT
jgi:hypothetical protein